MSVGCRFEEVQVAGAGAVDGASLKGCGCHSLGVRLSGFFFSAVPKMVQGTESP